MTRSRAGLALLLLAVAGPVSAQPEPAEVGQWGPVQNVPLEAVHATLLPTGKVVMWPTYDDPYLWDPETAAIVSISATGFNVFCSGHCLLADGRVFVAGGHILNGVGEDRATLYDPFTGQWNGDLPAMNDGRWYPTNTVLSNGDVLVVSGSIDMTIGVNTLPQVWEVANSQWRDLTGAVLGLPLYPWMHLAPNGRVFNSGPSAFSRYLDPAGTGAWSDVAHREDPGGGDYWRDYGTSVLHDGAKVLVIGGGDPPLATAQMIDLNAATPAWEPVESMHVARRQLNATILPDGTVLVTGGSSASGFNSPAGAVYETELWDPATRTWRLLVPQSRPRLYHSTALLLPDGRVLSAGGDYSDATGHVVERSLQVYSPPYLFRGPRPTISTAPSTVVYGQAFPVGSPDAASISEVTLLRLASVTHAFNMDQRINSLEFTLAGGGTALTVVAPSHPNLAPPGYYMLFLLRNGVPSPASIVRLASPLPGMDLVIEELGLSVASLPASGASTVSYRVANRGTQTVTSQYRERLYLSKDAVLDAADVPLATSPYHQEDLALGATYAHSQTITVPSGTLPGPYFLLVKADPTAEVAEASEANNVAAIPLTVTLELQFSQASYSVTEGNGSVTITVTRSGPAATPVEVTYTVLPGSATPGADYGGTYTQVLTFAPNQMSRTCTLTIADDTLAEGPETVLLQLSNPTNGALLGARQTAVLTIGDNDAGGAFKFGQATYTATESSSLVNVTVSRGNGKATNGKVRIRTVGGTAVPGTDYVPLDRTLDFGGQSSMTVPITLLAGSNLSVDGPRTIQVALDQPSPLGLASVASPSTTTVTIVDNDVAGSVQFAPATLSILETAGHAILTVTRTGGAAMGAGANWEITGVGTAVHGTDYSGPTTGWVSFDSGSSQSIAIPLIDRPGANGTRTLQVKLTAGTGGAKVGGTSAATVSILSETVGFRFDKAQYPTSEGSGNVTVTVLRTGPSQPVVQVTVGTVDPPAAGAGTAAPVTDYTPAASLLSFPAGQTSKTFSVPLKNTAALDGSRTVNLALSGPVGGALGEPYEATVTIGDNDVAGAFRFATAAQTVTEGASNNVLVNIAVNRSGGSGGPVEVPWSVVGGTATTGDSAGPGVDVLIAPAGTLIFGPNESSKTIQATILPDSVAESNETVKIALGTPTLGGTVASPWETTLTIVDSDRRGTIQFAAPVVSVAEADATVQLTLTRTGNVNDPGAVTVEWAITGGTATHATAPGAGVDVVVPSPTTVEFLQGQTTKTIPLTTYHDLEAEGSVPETLVFTLQNPGPGWAIGPVPTTTLSLVEGTVQFSGLPYVVSEGSGSKTITITRSGVTTQPVTVSYTAGSPGSAKAAASPNVCASGDDYRPVTGMQTFNPGETTKSFTVPLCGDDVVEGDETLTLTLAVVSGPALIGAPGNTVPLTITENDVAGAIRFSSATYGASEGQGNATLTISRTGSGTGVTVHWAIDVDASTAVHGVDYAGPLEGDVDFGNQKSKALTIPLVNTSMADGPRTIVVALSNPLPAGLASLGGGPTQATLTITDNEPTLRLNSATYAVGEASASFDVTVLRGGPTSSAVSVNLVPQAISGATGGTCGVGEADFSANVIPVEIPAGQGSKTVPVPICGDTRAELPESFGLALQNPVGAMLGSPATATVSLTDNDLAGTLRWSVAVASGVEGTTLVLTVTRTGGGASDVTVQIEAQDGDEATPGADAVAGVDYQVLTPTPLEFTVNGPTQTVEIALLPRPAPQGPRSFRVILHDATGGAGLGAPATATVWIMDAN